MKKPLLLLGALVLSASIALAADDIKVACIGNSITYGMTIDNREADSYPAKLQKMLGDGYKVGNFGRNGATLLRRGHRPYMQMEEFDSAMAFRPDIAVIHLGINDTDPRDWPEYADDFVGDYLALIDSLRAVNPQVRIIMARLTPISSTHYRFRSGTRDWRLEVQQAIAQAAQAAGAELIDFEKPLIDRMNLLGDGLHPNAEGAELLAQTVYNGITGQYGGLQMSPVYQSGMVLQRNRPLTLRGTANAADTVRVSLDGRTYTTTADNRGRWRVTTSPLVSGKKYRLTASDGRRTLDFTDIEAGELWIASGQSNMAFPLVAQQGGKEATGQACDPLLRIYDMRPIAYTDNTEWADSTTARIDRLEYFAPTRWQYISPDNAGIFSAIAYTFGRELRDSLQVPVGIIANAVGGAPCESYIDAASLQREMPEILANWRSNDYVQPWCQQRAAKNMGSHGHRHPYEPSYLFSAAINPLDSIDVAGVIWYQGESNAHNTMLHEQLFPVLTDSWRAFFNNPDMPFYYVQLSSLDRPSWPTFRDSQRRLASSRHGLGMVVSSDLGDSLDVHPTNKRPIGHRLALQALHHTYGRTDINADGPTPARAIAADGAVYLTMANATHLTTSDGLAPRTFEVAGADGVYRRATAEIISPTELKIYNMDIAKPVFVRYGWQPFTTANLTDEDSLPASTFKTAVDNAADYGIEEGIEHGVSAPFAGFVNGRLILAGGCNFPVDPMGPGSQKRFYKGIYAANTASMQWQRIGSLPEGIAYGATAAVPEGLVLIGGTSASESKTSTALLTIDGDKTSLSPLPSLPAAVDNMAAAAIGRRIYVCGGNENGIPSRQLLVLDLEQQNPQWKRLAQLPGNPRVQPAMAVASDAAGEQCLYIWGGFAGKHNGHDATLETSGLKYSPSKNKFTRVAIPVDPEGVELTLGGGAATSLSDGRIAAIGGVNKDIFLAALQNQAPDYLQHPIEWYRFNPNVLVYNPLTDEWTVASTTPDAARAGAAVVAGPHADIYVMGGELKPRIRTSQTIHIDNL